MMDLAVLATSALRYSTGLNLRSSPLHWGNTDPYLSTRLVLIHRVISYYWLSLFLGVILRANVFKISVQLPMIDDLEDNNSDVMMEFPDTEIVFLLQPL